MFRFKTSLPAIVRSIHTVPRTATVIDGAGMGNKDRPRGLPRMDRGRYPGGCTDPQQRRGHDPRRAPVGARRGWSWNIAVHSGPEHMGRRASAVMALAVVEGADRDQTSRDPSDCENRDPGPAALRVPRALPVTDLDSCLCRVAGRERGLGLCLVAAVVHTHLVGAGTQACDTRAGAAHTWARAGSPASSPEEADGVEREGDAGMAAVEAGAHA
mmetsp:Transcript_30648/g.69130  ORF Transcript_30648/g.69130 Transcript_30648/m.69130 type:complete len:214 (+) Transcript_30648:150-791(+)